VARRLRRMQAIVEEARDPVVLEGALGGDVAGAQGADVVLLSWGSTVEACREAADRLRARGRRVRVVGIRLLWPFPRQAVAAALGHPSAGRAAPPIVCVEANGFGQLARLVKSELPVHDRLRSLAVSDGRPIPSDAILDSVLDALDALEEVA
jgi:2-oxoglutarate/2-oxoacid ferredoxin oxidoreductase subunit alpha